MSGDPIEYVMRAMRGGLSVALIQRVHGDRDGRVVAILDKSDATKIGVWLRSVRWKGAPKQRNSERSEGER